MRTARTIHRSRAALRRAIRTVHAAALSAAVAGLLASPPVGAQSEPAAQAAPLEIARGRSLHLSAPWRIKGASLTDPDVADVQVLSPTLLLVSGKSPGRTDLLAWSEGGDTRAWEVIVRSDLSVLEGELRRLFPDARLSLSESHGLAIVSGVVARAEQAQAIHAWLDGLELAYVDLTRVAGVQQVQIKVRIAEVSRTAIRALGVNGVQGGSEFFFGSTVGPAGGGPIQPVHVGPPEGASALGDVPYEFNEELAISPVVTLFAGFPKSDLEVFFQALADNQYLRLLAEPNLVALSGEHARFLAGGEIPIPVVQGAATGTGASITIEYKPFGVGLQFRPVVLGDGSVRLQVASEVSELTDVGAVQIQGFQIPALVTRKAETTLEMRSGQTFAMAGLLNQSVNAQASRIPGLSDLPLLGSLFRSVRYKSGETELVVLVTVELVEPLSETALLPLPGEEHVAPSDWELYSQGRVEGGPPPRLSQRDAEWFRAQGFHRLAGPGAWATHDDGPAPSTARPAREPDAPRTAGGAATPGN